MNAARTIVPPLLLAAILSGSSPARAAVEKEFGVDVAVRTGQLDWSIAGGGLDVLSELKWESLRIVEVRGYGELAFGSNLVVAGGLDAGAIVSGDNRDSDYAGSGRTLEYSRSENNGGGDSIGEARLSLGYRIARYGAGSEPEASVTPFVGYAYRRQTFRMTDGRQTLSNQELTTQPLPPVGPIDGLHSTYRTRWDGPLVGVEAGWNLARGHRISGRIAYHWADYLAEADWNLRDDFAHPKSFEQTATGTGLVLSGRWRFPAERGARLSLLVEYETWTTRPGLDRTFLATGETADSRLNEVSWRSLAVAVGASFGR